MGVSVHLVDKNGEDYHVESHTEGGTICVGGQTEANMSVTYNYSGKFGEAGVDLHSFHGKQAKETINVLESAVKQLGTDRAEDYWEATEGNAGHALSIMLMWAKEHPEAKWEMGF